MSAASPFLFGSVVGSCGLHGCTPARCDRLWSNCGLGSQQSCELTDRVLGIDEGCQCALRAIGTSSESEFTAPHCCALLGSLSAQVGLGSAQAARGMPLKFLAAKVVLEAPPRSAHSYFPF